MKCSYCGIDLPPNAKYCPNCAEPVIEPPSQEELLWEEKKKELENKAKRKAALSKLPKVFAVNFITLVVLWLVYLIIASGRKSFPIFGTLVFLIILPLVLTISGYFFCKTHLTDREIIKYKQFCEDSTSICPMCGSHSIKIYRKGYNWNEAFWGNMFNIKGSRYTAGMNSNDTICYCENCKHQWNAHSDYRIERQQRK